MNLAQMASNLENEANGVFSLADYGTLFFLINGQTIVTLDNFVHVRARYP